MNELCCCEYIDDTGERNHILACCCNCQDLDEGFEGIISGQGVSAHNKSGLYRTMRDRIRIPWLGGARQVGLDFVGPVLLMPSLLLFATINLQCTIAAGLFTVLLFLFVYKYCIEYIPKFFIMWTVTSVVVVFSIFEVIVVSFLFIYQEENIAASIAMVLSIYCIYKARTEALRYKESIISSGRTVDRLQFCSYCDSYTAEGSFHRFWIDTCITPASLKYYIVALISALASLLYSSNLTLTSVCHSFRFIFTVLLPDDCSDVYNIMELSLSFTSALYSIAISVFMSYELLIALCACKIFSSSPRLPHSHVFNCIKVLCCCLSKKINA